MIYSITHHPEQGAFVWRIRDSGEKLEILGRHVETISLKKFMKGRTQPVSDERILETITPQLRPGHKAYVDHGNEESPAQVHVVDPNLSRDVHETLSSFILRLQQERALEQPSLKRKG